MVKIGPKGSGNENACFISSKSSKSPYNGTTTMHALRKFIMLRMKSTGVNRKLLLLKHAKAVLPLGNK